MATLQKLLWTREYSDFGNEVVLVESRFVLERKHGECLCMVHAGLTETVVLIAEESVESNADHLRTVVVPSEAQANVEYLHLVHLFPLQNTKLSSRRHHEHRNEHVLRLRLSTGKTWYLELADGGHREDRWREWLSWIHDLDEKRLERRHERQLHGTKRRVAGPKPLEDQDRNRNATSNAMKPIHPLSTEVISTPIGVTNQSSTIDNQDSVALLAAAQHQKRRESRAYHWVGHFQGALSRDHDGTISADDHDTPDIGLPGHLPDHSDHDHHSDSIVKLGHGHMSRSVVMDPTASFVWHQPGTRHSLPVRTASNSSTDTYSSLEDIESIGSLLGDATMDCMHPLSGEIDRKLFLCVRDLFQKFNIEAHGHGHVGRWRPMASLTAVDQLRDSDIKTSHREKLGLSHIPKKETLQHRCSLPDVLEGEAGFLDDMHRAAEAVHRKSLVYMDLVNDDDSKTPHVMGGHVRLLSPEQSRLQGDIARSREMLPDLEFVIIAEGRSGVVTSGHERDEISDRATATSDGEAPGKTMPQRKRRKSIGESLKERLHLRSSVHHKELNRLQHATDHSHRVPAGHLSSRILNRIRRHKRSRREDETDVTGLQQLTGIHEIDPELLANELTLVDSLLFVRVREAELVDCLWLKGDRHARAPHTTRLIEFFERVVGLVSTEILLQSTAKERAATVARFVAVAEWCLVLQNFHSLKAVLSGLNVLPVYRLKATWQAFEEGFPNEFALWNELVCLMVDDGRSDLYKAAVRESMRSPPCLPFVGTFLLKVEDLYSAVDRGGMRHISTRGHGSSSSSVSRHPSTDDSESSKREINYVTDDVNTILTSSSAIQSKSTARQAGFFETFASVWHAYRHKPDKPSHIEEVHPKSSDSGDSKTIATHTRRMAYARKAHIRRLVISYAKRIAQESGMAWGKREAVTIRDLLGAAFFAGVDNPINWELFFAKVQPAGLAASSLEEAEEKEEKRKAEYELYEMMFEYQMAAVQFRHTESNISVREYLLRACYNSDDENYRLSVSREPPSD